MRRTTDNLTDRNVGHLYPSITVEMTGIHFQHTHLEIATREFVAPENPRLPIPRRRKASRCRNLVNSSFNTIHSEPSSHHRISPRHSSVDVSIPSRAQSPSLARTTQPEPQKEPETEMELEIPTTPPPVEATLAARRAKRLAILAKYSNQPTPVPSNIGTPLSGTSSAVPPPLSTASISNNLSQINRAELLTPLSPATPAYDCRSSSFS